MTVYFIGNEVGEIKIEYTTRPIANRLSDLQVGNPSKLTVLTHCPGSRKDEQELHARFASFRIGGEWFSPNTELHQLICALQRAKNPRLPNCHEFICTIELVLTKLSSWKISQLRNRVKRLGFNSIEDWGRDVLLREADKLTFEQEARFSDRVVSTTQRYDAVLRNQHENLATISDAATGRRIDIGIYNDTTVPSRPIRVVGLRRWRKDGTGWVPALATLIFPDEILPLGNALRTAFHRLVQPRTWKPTAENNSTTQVQQNAISPRFS
jgi:hypothetical protein